MKQMFKYLKSIGLIVLSLLSIYLLDPFNLGYFAGYLLFPVIILKKDFILKNLDSEFALLSIFSLVYACFYAFQASESLGNQFIVIYGVTPPILYLTGKYLGKNTSSAKTIVYIIFCTTMLFSLSAIISVFLNFLEGGFTQKDRNIPMFWNGNTVSATIMGAYLTFNMCIPALLIGKIASKNIFFKIISVVLFIVSLICVLRIGSRTQLAIALITSLISTIYVFRKQTFKQNVTLMLFIGFILFLFLKNISFDADQDWLTTFADRMNDKNSSIASGGGRSDRWVKSVEYLFKKPLGWNLKEFGYAHNLWFDVLRVGGVISFALLVLYTIKSFFQIKKIINTNSKELSLNVLILIYSLAFVMIFMVEPIFEGIFSLFVLFCLFKGIINKYYENLELQQLK